MKTDELIAAVRETARIDSREHAERAVQATLTVLGERLQAEGRQLAAQLPPDLAEWVQSSPEQEVRKYDLAEFYHRVADLEGGDTDDREARQHARAVMVALRETVGAEYRDVVAQLPNDYGDLTQLDDGTDKGNPLL